ncbi:TonB-dependent receptor plug domain-containing protein [Pedobacter sp. ASV12]|uniref:TonB-dependent receptor plug domain-containing protein n=1 Tax=Pedobacter sp. ASV12 TaxID=2795120 RepID=UPI0018EC70F0|nr:TonB-dependent receptor [Pedobacter sp. ASV12]
MNKTIKCIAAGLGLAQLVLMGGQTKAQEVQSLNEVVIAATKNNQKQAQTGKVVSVITREELERSAGRNLAELLNQQAGINVVGAGSNYGKDKSVFFRGAGSAYAVILVDGIPVTDPSGTGGAFDLRMFAIDQIDHIEILRGGQSTLYGSDAVAGVINIITKKTGTKGNNVYGVASAGSYNSYKGTIGLSSKVDAFTYNVSYSHFKTDGISEAANPEGNTQVFDKDGVKQDALNANFSLQLDKRLSINPFLRYFYGKFNYDAGPFADANNTSTVKHFNGGLNAQYQLDKGKITLNYSYENTGRVYKSSFPGQYQGRMNLVDLFYNQNLGEKVNLLVGLDNRSTDVTYYGNVLKRPNTNLFSTYGSLFLHDLSIFNLEVGGRYNKHNKYGENYTYAVTPSLNIIKEVKLFGTVSSAFRAPTLDMLFGQYGANLNLKPEKATNYEAGASFNFLKEKISLRAVAFKRDMTDAINYGATGYINQDKQKDRGFEIEPGVTFSKFTVKGYYAYVEGKQTSGNTVTDFLLRRPKNTYGVNAGVQATKELYLSANYKFTGQRVDSDFSSYPSVNKMLGSYRLLDFYAEYALAKKRIKIFADLKNLTDEKYAEIIGYSTMGFNMNAGVSFNFK